MVYQILNENELCTYYNLDAHPGISPEIKSGEKYAYLEDEEIINQLLDFRNGNEARVTFLLPQMHCASCVWLLEKLYKLNTGISRSTVNYPKKQVHIHFDISIVTLRELVLLLSSLGYEPALSLADADKRKVKHSNKKLYFQIGIAGFCFGNIMLFSMPEYFDFTGDLTRNFRDYFGFINLIFALPVLLYSDLDYFRSAIGGLRRKVINLDVPLSLGMVTLFVTSLFEILSGQGPGYLDSFTGLVFFLLLGRAFQQKTFQTISFERDYKSYFPLYANIIKEGRTTTMALEKVKKGDRLVIRHNDLIPADGILLKGPAYIDYSFVTGESEPVFKELGEMIYAGGKQIGNAIEMETIREVSNSYLTELWNNQTFREDNSKNLKALSDTIGKWFTIAVLSIALVSALFWLPELGTSIKIFAAVLIVACPCALALSIPYTFGNAIRILGSAGFYLKNANVVEKLAKSDYIIFDKTGTLTDSDAVDVEYEGESLNSREISMVKSLAGQSSHPMSRKLFESISAEAIDISEFHEEIGHGVRGIAGGNEVRIGSAEFTGDSSHGGVHIAIDGEIKGRYIFHSKLRKATLEQLPKLANEYEMALCSGDSDKDRKLLGELLPPKSPLRFHQKPEDKLRFVNEINKSGKNTVMIGDGLNDAGALKASNVGISITDNTGHFSPASDVIMDSEVFDNFDKILSFSKFSVRTVKASFVLSALYNITGLVFAVQGLLTPVFAAILMPLSSVTVVIFATAMTNVKAKQLKLR
jgi:Cu+-exporting ATPase